MRLSLALLVVAIPAVAAPPPRLEVTSTAFRDGEEIPAEYTCDGASMPPPLSWSETPATTKSIAILVDDPDAPGGVYTHWIVTGIPPHSTSLASGATGMGHYAPPCPPSGRHHYRFRVYALDRAIGKSTSRAVFEKAISGHVVAQGELVGTYEKHR
jgi:Raf kinase inhibitor-like YbhB/YbcL family protein